jgi:hypothetical protein
MVYSGDQLKAAGMMKGFGLILFESLYLALE